MKKEALAWYGPVLLAGVLIFVANWLPAYLERNVGANTMSIDGVGVSREKMPPDIATIDLAIVANLGVNSKEVSTSIAEKSDRLTAYLKSLKDVTYTNSPLEVRQEVINVGAKYAKSFTGRQNFIVTIRDLTQVQTIIDKALEIGINDVGSVQYALEKMEPLRFKAREAAIALARKSAETVAQQLGVKVGKLLNFTESIESSGQDSGFDDNAPNNSKMVYASHRVNMSFSSK